MPDQFCTNCGATLLPGATSCASCGATVAGATTRSTSEDLSSSASAAGRSVGAVIGGLVAGALTGPIAIAGILKFLSKDRRADPLLGAWIGLPIFVVLVGLIAVLAFGGDGDSSTAGGPDRVVSVTVKCDGPGGSQSFDYSPADCLTKCPTPGDATCSGEYLHANVHRVVVVRTGDGKLYQTQTPLDTAVSEGDTWPLVAPTP